MPISVKVNDSNRYHFESLNVIISSAGVRTPADGPQSRPATRAE